MSNASSNGTLRLLVVEGAGDEYFFTKLLEHLGKQDCFEFVDCEGKHNLDEELTNILNRDDFAQITDIGIVLDNDYPENQNGKSAFASVIQAIEDANNNFIENNPDISRSLSLPREPREKTKVTPRISVLLFPTDNDDGTVEDLVFSALPKDSILDCVNAYFTCLHDAGVKVNEARLPKSKLSVYISGKVTDEDFARHDDAKRLFLTQALDMKWWRDEKMWDHPAFDDAKTFLTLLLDD